MKETVGPCFSAQRLVVLDDAKAVARIGLNEQILKHALTSSMGEGGQN